MITKLQLRFQIAVSNNAKVALAIACCVLLVLTIFTTNGIFSRTAYLSGQFATFASSGTLADQRSYLVAEHLEGAGTSDGNSSSYGLSSYVLTMDSSDSLTLSRTARMMCRSGARSAPRRPAPTP
jgi:hypothetical protein